MAQLCHYQEELERLNAEVWLITFSWPDLADAWRQETCAAFRMLLDPERKTYTAYGLKRSRLRSWNLKTLWAYARLLLSGRKWRGIQGDSTQLGGDFVVDQKGILRLSYPSQDAADRPRVGDIMAVLRQINESIRKQS